MKSEKEKKTGGRKGEDEQGERARARERMCAQKRGRSRIKRELKVGKNSDIPLPWPYRRKGFPITQ